MLKKTLSALLLGTLLMGSTPQAEAAVQNITATGEYILTLDVDSPTAAREMARERAKQAAVEKCGVFVKSYTEAQKQQITQDKIIVIAGSVLEIMNEDIKMQSSADNKTIIIHCTIQAKVDTDKIDLQKIVDDEEKVARITQQNQRIRELEQQTESLKSQVANLQEQSQRKKLTEQLDANQKFFLIAKYERDIDIYDLNNNVSGNQSMEIAQKLNTLDPQNTIAFRCMLANYRSQQDISRIETICQQVLNTNSSADMKINACVQLGDIYFSERNDRTKALIYVNQAIALAKNRYTANEIERLVNGTNVEVKDAAMTGRSNAIRELFVLKNDLEGYPPQFKAKTVVEDLQCTEYRIYDIRYKTDWSADNIAISPPSIKKKLTIRGYGCLPSNNSLIPKTFARQAAILDAYNSLFEASITNVERKQTTVPGKNGQKIRRVSLKGEGYTLESEEIIVSDENGQDKVIKDNIVTEFISDAKLVNKLYRHCRILEFKDPPDGSVEVVIEADKDILTSKN